MMLSRLDKFNKSLTRLTANNRVGSLVEFLIPVLAILVLVSNINAKVVIVLMLIDLIIKFIRKGL